MAEANDPVTRRRRGASVKRRSPSSGARRRAPTPDPPKDLPLDDEEPPVKPKKRTRDKSAKRSLSSPGDDRVPLDEAVAGDGSHTIITQSKREFRVQRVHLQEANKEEVTNDVKKKEVKEDAEKEVKEDAKNDVKEDAKEELKEDGKKEVKEDAKNDVKEDAKEELKEDGKKEVKEDSKKEVKEDAKKEVKEAVWRPFLREIWQLWHKFKRDNHSQYAKLISQRNRCVAALLIVVIYCGLGGFIFRFTEGAFETFYKCGVKRVKRNFVDDLWLSSHNLREEEWKSLARRRLMELENQLHEAHEAGVQTYSGQRAWSFLNAVVYCLTVVTTIGYGHLAPSTNTGRAITIVYAIFGIPLFLILLADFGKLFTRGIKFLWAFVRRVYFTGSCRKVRRTVPVQEVMKGVQLVYDFATFRRPSQVPPGEEGQEDEDAQTPLQKQTQAHVVPLDGMDQPSTPAPSVFEVDDEFNLPISIAIVILLAYIFVGASVYFMWENWGFFESFYFVFISMSTIGFGDFVPQHPMYMMASIVYLVFGLALTSMCINVVQEKLSDSFRQASAKIGATIGLRVTDEDGMLTPAPEEVPKEKGDETQPKMTKSAST
ncbi:potassium channel subfamily K member 18 isoform X2 [Anabrus simplex]|uniref:potassium channel subfamily K member 18 isoform X2 n=1 Tax=Anabrus simplex TaxID=316456 RepID=UPI0035A3578A